MRSSYSTPAAFRAARASERTRSSWAASTGPGLTRVASTTLTTSSDQRWRCRVEAGHGLEDEGAERAVEGEVGLQVASHPDSAPQLVGLLEAFQCSGGEEGAVDGDALADEAALHGPRLVVVGDELARGHAQPSPGRSRTLSSVAWLTRS